MYSNLVHMLDKTNCFFIVEGSANCFGTVHAMFVVWILLVFVVVFECISSNIVKWDKTLSLCGVNSFNFFVFFLVEGSAN